MIRFSYSRREGPVKLQEFVIEIRAVTLKLFMELLVIDKSVHTSLP